MEVGSERTCNRLPCSRLCRLKKNRDRGPAGKENAERPRALCVTKFCLRSLGFPVFRPFRAISIFGRHSRSSENGVDFHTAQLLPLFLQPRPSLCLKSVGVVDVVDVFVVAVPPPLVAVPPPLAAVPPPLIAVPPHFVAVPAGLRFSSLRPLPSSLSRLPSSLSRPCSLSSRLPSQIRLRCAACLRRRPACLRRCPARVRRRPVCLR